MRFTPEERRQIGLRSVAGTTPELRSDRSRRGWITRRGKCP
jgi:hypothetical protein